MGQQQLLLLVLGIVIVGLAVVVGINAFSENRTKSNADALVTDGLRIASDVQAWALKPGQFGGALLCYRFFRGRRHLRCARCCFVAGRRWRRPSGSSDGWRAASSPAIGAAASMGETEDDRTLLR